MLPPKWAAALGAIVATVGVLVLAMGALTFTRGRALAARGVVTDAELVAVGHRRSDSDTGHQVRYRFTVDGRQHERVGIFGTGVGSDVTAETQAEAVASGRIAVRYLPDEPSVNEPVAHRRPQAARGAIAVAIGLALLLGGLLRLGLSLRAMREG